MKVEDVDLEPPKAGEVRVKVVAHGLCHSDDSVIRGVLPFPLPMVFGHEGARVVEEVSARRSGEAGPASTLAV